MFTNQVEYYMGKLNRSTQQFRKYTIGWDDSKLDSKLDIWCFGILYGQILQ